MYLPDTLWCKTTVILRFDGLSEVEGATDPKEAEEDGCTNTTAKDWNQNYCTEAIGASKLRDSLSNHHRAD